MPLPVYAEQRQTFGRVMAAAIKDGDDPTIVAKVIVVAATDPKPKLRYTASTLAGRASGRYALACDAPIPARGSRSVAAAQSA